MSTVTIVVLVVLLVVGVLLATGLLANRRQEQRGAAEYREHVLEADDALERARAADKGWDRELLDNAAREYLNEARPGWAYDDLHLVLVDDREGVVEDRAHLVATGPDGEARVVLARRDGEWAADSG